MKIFDIYCDRSEDGYEPNDITAFGIQTDDGLDIEEVYEGMSPEDVMFGRNLSFVLSIPNMLKKAYDQGRKDGYRSHVEHVPELEFVNITFTNSEEYENKIVEINNESKKVRS